MINYRILPKKKLIVLCNWGLTPVEDIFRLRRDLLADADYSPDYEAILDTTYLDSHYMPEEIWRISRTGPKERLLTGRLAVIAPSDVVYGISRMHQMASEDKNPFKMLVFRDPEAALKWLGRDEVDIERIFQKIREEKQ
jgi:hypothetical protein